MAPQAEPQFCIPSKKGHYFSRKKTKISAFEEDGLLEDDQIFLHYQERYLEAKGGSTNFSKAFYLPTKADSFVFELRQWVNEYKVNPFPGEVLPPRLTKEQLLDRYHSHTKNRANCRTALTRIQQLKFWCAIIGAIAWISLPLLAFFFANTSLLIVVFSAFIPLVFGAAWLGLSKLEKKFYIGRAIPPRNLPEKKS